MRGDARYTKMTKTALTEPKSGVREITMHITQQGTPSHGDEAGQGHTGGPNSAWEGFLLPGAGGVES